MKNYDYGIIGNCTSAALVSKDCSIDWLCLPFFDSPSVFSKILDETQGGCFRISARDIISIKQTYIPHTPILKTRFKTKTGCFEVRDFMPRFLGIDGVFYCPSEIHRDIMLIEGAPEVIIEFSPRPNYACCGVRMEDQGEYIKVMSEGGEYESFYVYTNIDAARILKTKSFPLKESKFIVLTYHEKLTGATGERTFLEYEKTKAYWMDWSFSKVLPERDRDIALRSLITLKLLMYQRTGAVIAAPTTSLPEIIGKDRNWDYRFCWTRDAAMIVDLYIKTGDMTSANRYITFILNRMLLKRDKVDVMYGINGERMLEERTLEHLDGYMGSRPVRIGNAAYSQVQNDVYGELIETLYTYFIQTRQMDNIHFNEEIWTAVRSLARKVMEIWDTPDAGIWEMRGDLKHYVHSKLMCWVALDRAAKIGEFIGRTTNVKAWRRTADKIKKDVLTHGWNEELGAFTMSYGSTALDASNLLMLHYGFLDKDDPRMISTIKMTYKHLVKNGFVFRYLAEDDFGLPENAFIVCTFWMINALYIIGEKKKAKEMFDRILARVNDLGLLSEDLDVQSGRLTGNFPQGYSHLALIQTMMLFQTEYDWSDV